MTKTQYSNYYKREKLKRVPLDMPKEKYEIMKRHCEESHMPVNSFIKRAIEEKIEREKQHEERRANG